MGDILEVLQLVIMGLLVVLLVWAALAVGLWATQWATRIWEQVEVAWVNIRRSRADAKIVTMRPGEVKITRDELKQMTAELVRSQFDLAQRQLEAMKLPANVPHSITYSPHYAPHMRQMEAKPLPQIEAQLVPAGLLADHIPSVQECYARGMFDDPRQLMIGFDPNAGALFSPIEDTYGVAVAGVPKMGKTTGMRLWALQMALHGAQVAIIDPAANSPSQQGLAANLSGLRSHLWEQPAAEPDAIVKMLGRIEAMGAARNRGQDAARWPLMLMIDEMTSLVNGERGGEIANLIMRISRQYRKEHIYTIAAGQDWLGNALGGDIGLRRAFVCKAIYRVDADNGRKLSARKPLIDMVPSLQRGQMVWVDAYANQSLVTVPDCTSADVAVILGDAEAIGSPSHTGKEPTALLPSEADGKDAGSDAEGQREVDGEVAIDAGKLRQIQDYGAQGWSTHKIVGVVFGLTGGRAYNDARCLVNKILGREG